MCDPSKKDHELLEEISSLKQRIQELEQSEENRKRVEEALLESEYKFKNMVEQAHSAIYLIQDGIFKYVNPQCAQMFGYTVEECLNDMPFKNLVYVEDLDKLEEQVGRQAVKESRFNKYNFRGLKKNGQIFHVELYESTNVYKGRLAFTGTLMDITDRKRAEEELRKSDKRYREFFAQSRDCVFITSKEGKWIDFNRAALEMFGYDSREELSQISISALYVNPKERKALTAIIEKHGYVKEYPAQLRRKDGVIIDTLITIGCQNDADDPTIKYYGTIRDITKHKNAEDALKASEQRLMDIIDFLPDPTIAIDLEGKVIAWNRAMEEMTGINAQDMLGKGDHEYAVPFFGTRTQLLVDLVLNPNDKIEKRYSFLKRQKELLVVEGFVPCLRGGKVCLWGKASPLYDGKGNIIGAIESIRDITERKNDEEILRKREKELELKKNELQDLNTALRILLKQREGDRHEMEVKVLSNIKLLIHPFIEKLKKHSDPRVLSYINLIEVNLNEIISPFSYKLSSKHLNLTNKEIEVANLIKEEKTSKEIAAILNSSVAAVNVHRFHIRKKLNLTKTQNLRAYLSSLNQH